ncbi:WAT1-related protein At4g30420 [Linum perenne]
MASSSMGSATGNLVPGITFVMAVIFGLEKVNLRSVRSMAKIVGTILCVTGALTMALIKGPQLFLNNGLGGNEEDWLLGCCFLFASACCWSIWLILQGVVGSGIAFFVQAWCISQRGPLFSALFNPLCTVIVTVLASFLLDEKIYVGSLIGAIGVVVGLYAVLWGKSKDYAKKVEGEIDPKPTKDETQVRTMLIDEECLDETKSKICDIEEPLLCNKI